ncbi:MAG: AraC family transcriptional regulator [Steroidobacteraceae bacterium]
MLLPVLEGAQQSRSDFIDHILCAFYSHLCATEFTPPTATAHRERLTAWQERVAKEVLSSNPEKGLRISEVAERCKLSRSHFTRAFKRTTGYTPQRWLLLHRIERAKSMLHGNRPIAAIAAECGFADQSHLTRAFTRVVGTPPATFRRGRLCKS